jgi:serine hydrolase
VAADAGPARAIVAPPASDHLPEGGASFCLDSFDAAAVRAWVDGEIAMACADADPYNPDGAQALCGDALGITAELIEGAGHITPDSGYGPWPYALEWCLGA